MFKADNTEWVKRKEIFRVCAGCLVTEPAVLTGGIRNVPCLRRVPEMAGRRHSEVCVHLYWLMVKVKVKQSHYRPGVTQRVQGG